MYCELYVCISLSARTLEYVDLESGIHSTTSVPSHTFTLIRPVALKSLNLFGPATTRLAQLSCAPDCACSILASAIFPLMIVPPTPSRSIAANIWSHQPSTVIRWPSVLHLAFRSKVATSACTSGKIPPFFWSKLLTSFLDRSCLVWLAG
jgi:hypothetical protein